MSKDCVYCEDQIITEADSYALLSTREGHKFCCFKCVVRLVNLRREWDEEYNKNHSP